MKASPSARAEIFKIIQNQIDQNDPPLVRITYRRLLALHYDQAQAMQLIGYCLLIELYDVMKHKKKFNEARYILHLKNLPEKPVTS